MSKFKLHVVLPVGELPDSSSAEEERPSTLDVGGTLAAGCSSSSRRGDRGARKCPAAGPCPCSRRDGLEACRELAEEPGSRALFVDRCDVDVADALHAFHSPFD